jgi:TonB-dependent receptor
MNSKKAHGYRSPAVVATVLMISQVAHAQTPLDAKASSADSLEEVVVVGQRASLEKAVQIKRNAAQVVDSVVADDIGKFPDNTVAEALQRVPGIQTVNGFNNEIINPLIRGLGDILTTVDGREMFTGVGRGFAFQDLPAEALARADVYKSSSADLIEGGVAGVIDLRLHKPFDFKEGLSLAGTARGFYGEEVGKTSYKLGFLASERQDTSVGQMGLLVDVSYSDIQFNRPISFNCDPRSGSNGPPGAPGIVLPTCVGGLTDTGAYQRPQANVAFQWRPNEKLEVYADGLFAGYRTKFQTDFIFTDIFGANNITNPVATSDCFSSHVNGAGFLGSNTDPIQNLCFGSSASFNSAPGTPGNQGLQGLTSTQAKTAKTDQYQIGGGVKYNDGNLHLGGDLSELISENSNRNIIVDIGKQIAQANIVVNNGGFGTTDMPGNPLGNPTDFRFRNSLYQDINRSDSRLTALNLHGQYDLSVAIQLQFGFRYGDRSSVYRAVQAFPGAPGGDRNTRVNSVGLPSNFLVVSPADIPQINGGAHWLTPNADYLRSNTDQLRALYGQAPGDPAWNPTENFDAKEKTYAAYFQPKYSFQLGGGTVLDGLFGGRLTRTDRDLAGTGRVSGVLTPVTTHTSDTDFLPNLSGRLRFTPDTQLRFSAAQAISRPTFSDLNPGLTYSVPLNANIQPNGNAGNPNLKPQKVNAYDVTIEHYFSRSSYVEAAVYYRTLKDRVAVGSSPEVIGGITYIITRPRNLGSATLQGFELSAQYFFDSLPGVWSGLGGFGNYTYADSKIKTPGDSLNGFPLLGVSKNSYNVGGLYEKYGFTSRLVYAWRDIYNDFQFGCDLVPGQTFCGDPSKPAAFNKVKAYGRLDFSLGYDVSKWLTVSVDANNLTGAKYHSYFNTSAFPHDIRTDDRFYGVSARAKW